MMDDNQINKVCTCGHVYQDHAMISERCRVNKDFGLPCGCDQFEDRDHGN